MIDDIRETAFDHIDGNEFFSISTSERPWLNALAKLEEKYPEEVKCIAKNKDSGFYHIPKAWVKIRPPKQMNYTPEQLEAKREMMRNLRKKQ